MSNYNANRKSKKHGFLKFLIFIACALCMFIAAKKILDAGILDRGLNKLGINTGSTVITPPPTDNTHNNGGGDDDDLKSAIEALAQDDSRIDAVLNDMDAYPQTLLELLAKNNDARDFVLNYPQRKDDNSIAPLDASQVGNGIPMLYQWDDDWGYFTYGSGPLGITGCGPTCLSMVVTGLTGNLDAGPAAIAAFSMQNGYYVDGAGSTWDLMKLAPANYGLNVTELPLLESSMAAALEQGHPIIINVGEGDFTTSGHFIVLTSYEDGMFTVNDPNSKTLSAKAWSYSTLEPQIRNIWAFSLA